MKVFVIILNISLFLFTLMVLATDGPPVGAAYITLSIWTQLTRVLSIITIFIIGASYGWVGFHQKENILLEEKKIDVLRIVTVFFNVASLGFVIWAFIDQYPHPNEEGFIEYLTLMVLTPVLSSLVLIPRKAKSNLKTT